MILSPGFAGALFFERIYQMGKVICICGKISSGKTTYREKLCRESNAILLSVDQVMLNIFGLYAGDRHDEYATGAQKYLLEKSVELLEMNIDVVLDWGFWSKESRRRIKEFYAERGAECQLHYIDIPDSTWGRRIAKRNIDIEAGRTQAYIVDENLAAKFESMFEKPDKEEIDVWIYE